MTSTLVRFALALVLLCAPIVASAGQEASAKATPAVVNLNAATAAELESLPGIGPRAAQRILEFRAKNGGFKKVEDLMKIQGIGERSFLKLKPLVTVGSGKADGRASQ